MDEQYDAIVVGARCAGSTLATLLARQGRRVLLLDRDRFPSDTVSTHMMFPDTLDRLDELGVMQRLAAGHRLRPVRFSWRVLGHEVAGAFTPVGGYDRGACVRRIVLDAAMADAAAAAGAEVRFGRTVDRAAGRGLGGRPGPRRPARHRGTASARAGSSARTVASRRSPAGWASRTPTSVAAAWPSCWPTGAGCPPPSGATSTSTSRRH